jgi:hypothetical protein
VLRAFSGDVSPALTGRANLCRASGAGNGAWGWDGDLRRIGNSTAFGSRSLAALGRVTHARTLSWDRQPVMYLRARASEDIIHRNAVDVAEAVEHASRFFSKFLITERLLAFLGLHPALAGKD